MPTYIVERQTIYRETCVVEAESAKQAREVAEDDDWEYIFDVIDFEPTGNIVQIDEITKENELNV